MLNHSCSQEALFHRLEEILSMNIHAFITNEAHTISLFAGDCQRDSRMSVDLSIVSLSAISSNEINLAELRLL